MASAVNSGEVLGTVCQHKRFGLWSLFYSKSSCKNALEYFKPWSTIVLYIAITWVAYLEWVFCSLANMCDCLLYREKCDVYTEILIFLDTLFIHITVSLFHLIRSCGESPLIIHISSSTIFSTKNQTAMLSEHFYGFTIL